MDLCIQKSDLFELQIEGNVANAGDAIMLDKDGFVSETNATNIVRGSHVVITRVINYG